MSWWSRSKWGDNQATNAFTDTGEASLIAAPGTSKRIVIDDVVVAENDVLTAANAHTMKLLNGSAGSLVGGTIGFSTDQRTVVLYDLGWKAAKNTAVYAALASSLATQDAFIWVSYHIEHVGAE